MMSQMRKGYKKEMNANAKNGLEDLEGLEGDSSEELESGEGAEKGGDEDGSGGEEEKGLSNLEKVK
jgi:hypothetical protein